MHIRRASEHDAEQMCQVRALAIRAGAASHYSPAEVNAWLGTRTADFYLDPIRTKIVLVAALGAQIQGFGQLDPVSAVIEALYVAPAVMRQGVGTQLLAEIEALAVSLGLAQLRLAASLNAVAFYERAGYSAVRAEDHEVDQSDVVEMIKIVRAVCADA